MPIAIDPLQKFKISLSSDIDKPEAERPAFIYRYATGRQWLEAKDFDRKIKEAKSDKDMPFDTISDLFDKLRFKLIGWENMNDPETGEPISFNPAKLEDILTMSEAFELLGLCLQQRVSEDDKKKLESQSD